MTARTRLALALAFGGLCIVLDITITAVAIPALMKVFDAPLATMQWTATAYILALVTTLPLSAWLSTRYGARRTYVAAMLIFAVASALAGLAMNPGQLIAARVLQGLGGGLVNPVGMAIAMRGVPAGERGRVAALLGLPVLFGPLAGPILAGWLIDAISWRAIFFLTVPPALVAAVLVRRLAPPDDDRQPIRLDLLGLAYLVPGAVLTVFGLGEARASVPIRVGLVILGLALLGAFVRRSLGRSAPLLRVRLLQDRSFAVAIGVLVLFGAAYFGGMLLMPTYIQVIRGDSALMAGSFGIPAALAAGVSVQVCTRLIDRVEPWKVVLVGLVVALIGGLGTTVLLRTDTPYPALMATTALMGAGAGGVLMPTMTAATRNLNGADLASGSSIMGLLQQLANAVGTAAMTASLAATVAWKAPAVNGGLESVSRMPDEARAAVAPDLVSAQQLTQLLVVVLVLAALALTIGWMRPALPLVEPDGALAEAASKPVATQGDSAPTSPGLDSGITSFPRLNQREVGERVR